MAKEAGVVKSLTGKAVAVDQNGNERELKVGDIVYMGESVKTSDAADKVTIVANNGKELTVLGSDTLSLNPNTIGAEGLADISALQNAILNGGDLTKLEETAAGGNAAAGGGDGVSLGEARFAEGGHYSNINETYRNLTDTNRAFASYDSPIGGYSDGNSNGGDLIPPKPSVSVEFTEDKNDDGFLTYTENFDNNASSHDLNTSPVKITVANVVPGDILHVTLTKPDGTVTPLPPITINATDIVNNTFTKIISDMPVAEGKISKVDAYVTDSADPNTIKSNEASDSVTPDVRPTLTFTEDIGIGANINTNNPGKNDGGIDDFENSQDGNFRSTTVEVTLPKDVVAGDKIVITYTDPLTKQNTTKEVPLTQADVDNHKVNTSLPVFPDVTNNASVHVETHDGIQKSAESDKDSVMPIGRNMEIQFIEQDTLHEISRQESMDEHEVNETTALIRLPNKIDNGDIVTLTINEPTNGVYTRNFTINMNDKGEVTSITEIGNGEQNFPLTKESFNQYSFEVPGFDLRHGQDTTIKASITNMTPGRHTQINEPEVSASLEHVKAPEVIFDEAHNSKTMSRKASADDGDEFNTTATIKIPKNAVDGDRIEVKITEPQLDGTTKDRTLKFNVHKDASGVKITDEHGNDVAVSDNGFQISHVGTLTGAETKISATIIDKDDVQSATGTNSVSVTELDDSGIFFGEDVDANTSITRDESMKDHDLHKKKGDLHETDDYLHKTDLEVKVPNNVITGDKMILEVKADGSKTLEKEFTITRNGDNTITLKAADGQTLTADSDNKITVPGIVIGEGKNTEAKATFTDAKDHAKTIVTNHATLEKLHDDMTVIFKEDKDFNGILNRDEANSDGVLDKTTATIKLPSNVVDGDILKITTSIENVAEAPKPYTIHKDAQGKITVDGLNVVGNKAVEYTVPLEEDKTSKISATVSDATGVDKVKAGSDITLDADGNGNGTKFYVLIDEDKDRNGKLSRDEANSDGKVKATSATISLPSGDLHTDDTFVVKVNGIPTTYKVTSKVGDVLKIEDKDGNVHLEDGNLLKIDGIAVSVKNPAKVEVELPNGASKSAEAILEPINNKELSVIFNEDNANRNNELSRDEAISDHNLKTTTVSVKVPYNVVTGDHVKVNYVDPNTGDTKIREFEITKTAGGKITATDINSRAEQNITEDNTIKVFNVPMKPGEKTKVDATITTQDDQTAHANAEAKLEQLSSKGLSVSIAADANDNGIITRDESGSNKSKVNVSLPGNIIAGDSIKVEITNPGDTTPKIKDFKVLSKDALGKIELQDQDDLKHPFTLENGKPLMLDAAVAVGIDTVAKVTLTDAFNNSVSKEDKAHAEIDVVRGIQFTEDTSRDNALQDYENSNDQDTTPIKVYLNEDARVGDKVNIQYTDPNDHSQMKHVDQDHTITTDDIARGFFEQSLDINPISKYKLKVDATFETDGGLKKLSTGELSILPKAVTAEYNEHTTMKGGDNNSDTLIVDGHGQTIDFSHVAGLDAKVESFENIQLQGNSEIKFDAKAIFDITDSLNTILKIKGDATNKVDIKGKWELEKDPSIHADAGFKGYSSKDQVDGHTIHIQIDDKVQTDL
ncbi:retention module-containing protein [Campylobacter concisus]